MPNLCKQFTLSINPYLIMNQIRRILGIIWMLLGPAAIYMMLDQAIIKIGKEGDKVAKAADDVARAAAEAAKLNVTLQWGIIIMIFVPIAVGLILFGLYAFKGEYDAAEA